ncbi:hypothetical protein Cus16_2940 [Curtobacterium sp. ER1/6]|nr:hypothetical protein Cus16_2940 [Curtobacterium sp. ER1/6]
MRALASDAEADDVVVARPDRADRDGTAGLRRVHDHAVAHVEAVVRLVVEDDDVAGLRLGLGDRGAGLVLQRHGVREADAVLRVHVHDVAGAVEAGRVGAAEDVRGADVLLRGRDDRRERERGVRGGGRRGDLVGARAAVRRVLLRGLGARGLGGGRVRGLLRRCLLRCLRGGLLRCLGVERRLRGGTEAVTRGPGEGDGVGDRELLRLGGADLALCGRGVGPGLLRRREGRGDGDGAEHAGGHGEHHRGEEATLAGRAARLGGLGGAGGLRRTASAGQRGVADRGDAADRRRGLAGCSSGERRGGGVRRVRASCGRREGGRRGCGRRGVRGGTGLRQGRCLRRLVPRLRLGGAEGWTPSVRHRLRSRQETGRDVLPRVLGLCGRPGDSTSVRGGRYLVETKRPSGNGTITKPWSGAGRRHQHEPILRLGQPRLASGTLDVDVLGDLGRQLDAGVLALDPDRHVRPGTLHARDATGHDARDAQLVQQLGFELHGLPETPHDAGRHRVGAVRRRDDVLHAVEEVSGGGTADLGEPGDRVAVGGLGRVAEHLEQADLDLLAHHVLPPAGLVVHERPVQPDHVGEQAFGQTVLPHHVGRAGASLAGELQVPVAGDDDQAVALHAGDGLRDRRTGVPQPLGDARAQRDDPLFLEVEDRPQVHLRGVDEIGHACRLSCPGPAQSTLLEQDDEAAPPARWTDGRHGAPPPRPAGPGTGALGYHWLGSAHGRHRHPR